jgi:arylsulfatase A-like enzyme
MQQRDKGKPFCFWFGTYDPHRSYVKDSGAKSGIPVDKVQVPAFYPDTAEIRSDIADYYFEVERWDRDVGKAIKHLEAANELDNTIIVMTGDHGMPFPRCKANLYDWGTRVPLAIRWGQQVKLPRTVDKLVSLTDLAPTFLAVAGAEIPEDMTGNSLLPILKKQPAGGSSGQRDFIVFGRERHVPAQPKPSMQGYPARAIRTDRWMLKLNLAPDRWPAGAPSGATHLLRNFAECDDGPTKSALMGMKDEPKNSKYYQLSFAKRPAVELYDCKQDPDQINNLVDEPEHAGTVAKLRAQLLDYLRNTEDPRFTGKPVKFESYRYYGRL